MGNFTSSPGGRSLSRRRLLKMSGAAAGGVALSSLYGAPLGVHAPRFGPRLAQAAPPANEHFLRTWERTDRPVVEGMVSRTWMWGPEAFTGAMSEPYVESPEGERTVQYFDKARMEITRPDTGDPTSIWYVTNGLLVVELVTGWMQIGDATFDQRTPAQENVAGDGDDPNGPTYATFTALLDAAPLQVGSTITGRVSRAGDVTADPALAAQGITVGVIDPETNHSIAAPFWEFMNSSGLVYENGGYAQDDLFENEYFATGRPISEPYWADVKVAGTVRLVLMQCFERRCLTYTPGNDPGWLVEAGNVGLHYHAWRYGDDPGEPPPLPLGDFCVPVPEGYKPKMSPAAKLQRLAGNSLAPSTLASMFFQLERRYLAGHSPANELETAAFAAFASLPEATRTMLECALEKLDDLAPEVRDKLFDPRFDQSDTAVSPEDLANVLALEVVMHASQTLFGSPECMTEEHPGLARVSAGIDGEILFTPTIFRINDLRTIQFGLTLPSEYLPAELQQTCTVVSVDDDGDGVPDSSQLNCQTQMAPCPGHMVENVCLRIPEVRAGEMVKLTGANYFNVDAKVRFMIGGTTSDVEAHVCGDVTTPLTENVDGFDAVIRDNRVQDQLTFQVPLGFASGIYTIQVVVPNNTGQGLFPEYFGGIEYIRVVAPPSATFEIASEELFCIDETSPASFGSDEVGLRIVTVPVELDGTLGAAIQHKFGGGSAGLLEDVDSGETRDISRVLFSRPNIAGLAMAVIGYEVDSEDAYKEQVQGFIDAFIFVMESSIKTVASTLVGAVVGLVGVIIGLSAALVAAIAAVIVAAIVFFVALWAPADLIMQDIVGLTALELDELTSGGYPLPPSETYTTPGAIDVTVEPIEISVAYFEERLYRSDDEDSRYRISLRYSRTA